MTLSTGIPDKRSRACLVARAIACGLLLLSLPACGIPARRQPLAPPPLPESFNGVTSPENSSQLGVAEFYQDPVLLDLIAQAKSNNRELRILNEEVQIASNEILSRSGAYLPFLSAGPLVGLDRASNRTIEGAALRADPFLPGRFFSNPHGNYQAGAIFTWQLDIYRQLRNARDAAAQRYVAAIELRNTFVNGLVADVAENYYRLMALDKRLENLNQIIAFQEQSLKVAQARKEAARDTELAVLRFEAEVRRNQSEKLLVSQQIIEVENRINYFTNRFPQPVGRDSSGFFDLYINSLSVGVPSELLLNRPDIRQAEHDLTAAGLDVQVARANFYPQLILDAGVGLQSFNMAYLFMPQAVAGNLAAGFIGPLVNRRAIKAEYLTNDAQRMRAVYNYQLTVLNAFTEVVNRLTEVQNYSESVQVKKQQLAALENAVDVANQLFQFARTEYLDVLTAQRDLRDARTSLIDTKELQLTATVRAYEALGGGSLMSMAEREELLHPIPRTHEGVDDEGFWSLSKIHFGSGRYHKALGKSLDGIVPYRDNFNPPAPSSVPPPMLRSTPSRIDEAPAPVQLLPGAVPAEEPGLPPALAPAPLLEPPPSGTPGPFGPAVSESP